jgi:5-carboxymethyl-2-hydroxymuconate isomerase
MAQLRFPEWAHQELRRRPDYPDLMKDAKALLVTMGQFPEDPWQAMDEMETASLMTIAAMEPEHQHLPVLLQIQDGILRVQRHRIGG